MDRCCYKCSRTSISCFVIPKELEKPVAQYLPPMEKLCGAQVIARACETALSRYHITCKLVET